MDDYSKLQELAEKATPGPWDRSDGNEVSVSYEGDEAYWEWENAGPAQLHGSGDQPIADADFIAAASPATVLALLAEVARLRTAEGDAMTYKAGMENVAQQRDQLKAECDQLFGNSEQLKVEAKENEMHMRAFGEVMKSQAGQIEQLKAERDELKAVCGAFDRVNTKLKAEVEAFKAANAELSEINVARRNHLSNAKKSAGIGPMDDLVGAIEALRKGSERYQHLMKSIVPDEAIRPPRGLYVIFEDGHGFGDILIGEEASAEIDDAMSKAVAQ